MLYKYLLELKHRIILIIFSWIVTILICYYYKEILLFLLIKLNKNLYFLESFYFISTNLTDVFTVYLKLSYFISTQLCVFLLFYHFLIFISPGLFKHEYKIIKLVIIMSCFFFLFSVFVLNNFVLPYVWSFFLGFQSNQTNESINIFFEAQIKEYLKFYINMHYITIIISQIFVFLLLLLHFIENKIKFIIKTRKLIYCAFLIFSTIITPPDVISQIVISLCFILFYEFIIIINLLKIVVIK